MLAVSLKGAAQKAGFEQGFKVTGIEVLTDRPAKEWLYVLAFLLLAAIIMLQRMRREETVPPPALLTTSTALFRAPLNQ